jgi:serine protease Do
MTMRVRRCTVAVLLFAPLLAAFALGSPSAAQQREVAPVERVAALARPAVVYLETSYTGRVRDARDGLLWVKGSVTVGGRCSGSVVDPDGYILTAAHCVDPDDSLAQSFFFSAIVDAWIERGDVDPSDADSFYQEVAQNSSVEGPKQGRPVEVDVTAYRGIVKDGERDGKGYTAEVVDFRPFVNGDVALIKAKASGLPSILISDETELGVGTPVVAIGYPGSVADIIDPTLEPSFKDGTISGLRTERGVPFHEISAAVSPGMSGGPTVDLDGRIVGVNSHLPRGESQSFNFIASASLARRLLDENDVENRLAPVDRTYREGLEHLFAGRFKEAAASFDDVLEVQPDHQQATELKAEAEKRVGEEAVGGGFPLWLLLVPILAAAAAFAVTRRRPALDPTVPGAAPEEGAAPVQGAVPAQGACPKCGAELRPGVQFCTRCGWSVTDPGAGSAAAPGRRAWLVPAAVGAGTLVVVVIVGLVMSSSEPVAAPRVSAIVTEAPEGPDLNGTWDSNFGPVTLRHEPLDDPDETVVVTGTWLQGEGQKGKITDGIFDPSQRVLEIAYVESWTGVKGTASFELSEDGTKLTGTYEQSNSKGDWYLERSTVD